MHIARAALIALLAFSLPACANVRASLIPEARPGLSAQPAMARTAPQVPFPEWVAGFRLRAEAAGIRASVIDAALEGVTPDPKIIELDRNQSEFSKAIWEYLDSAVSQARVANGRAAMERHGAALRAAEARYGVPAEVVAAVWGLESAYGAAKGNSDIIRSLATLAHDGRRGAFFEEELIAALRIAQAEGIDPRAMRGSWAGAMGHTQFMPTSYLKFAVDGNGDGRRDIWGDDPTDALHSTARYLRDNGWTPGQPWGVEVRLPEGFDYRFAYRELTRLPSTWARIGVTGMDGRPVPDHGLASVLLPAGSRGPAFLVFGNFEVLETYNTADAYVIGVGHLSDRLADGGPFEASWPREDRALTGRERRELQRLLAARGIDPGGVDGKIGPLTIEAVRRFQSSMGLVPDGYANPALLARLRGS